MKKKPICSSITLASSVNVMNWIVLVLQMECVQDMGPVTVGTVNVEMVGVVKTVVVRYLKPHAYHLRLGWCVLVKEFVNVEHASAMKCTADTFVQSVW